MSPSGNRKNEIDYIMTNRKQTIHDNTMLNLFNTGGDSSDHRVVRAALVIDQRTARKQIVKKIQIRQQWKN